MNIYQIRNNYKVEVMQENQMLRPNMYFSCFYTDRTKTAI